MIPLVKGDVIVNHKALFFFCRFGQGTGEVQERKGVRTG
jgi:hypothetical protein